MIIDLPPNIEQAIIGRIEVGLFGQSNLDDFRLSKTNYFDDI